MQTHSPTASSVAGEIEVRVTLPQVRTTISEQLVAYRELVWNVAYTYSRIPPPPPRSALHPPPPRAPTIPSACSPGSKAWPVCCGVINQSNSHAIKILQKLRPLLSDPMVSLTDSSTVHPMIGPTSLTSSRPLATQPAMDAGASTYLAKALHILRCHVQSLDQPPSNSTKTRHRHKPVH
jgi:hypothetical protein